MAKQSFNEVIYSNFIKDYLARANKGEIAPNKDFSYIESLGLFDRKFLNRLDNKHRNDLVEIFNSCIQNHDFRPLVRIAEREIPNVSHRYVNGFYDVTNKIATRNLMTEDGKPLTFKSPSNMTYNILKSNFDKGLVARFIEYKEYTRKGIETVMSAGRGDGYSGTEFLSILSGAYYLADIGAEKAQSFTKFRDYQRFLMQYRDLEGFFTSLGIDYSAMQDLFKEGSVYDLEKKYVNISYLDASFDTILQIDKTQRKLTSLISKDIVKYFANLPTSQFFKADNELNRTQKAELQRLLARYKGESLEDSMKRLESFSAVIDNDATQFYNTFKYALKDDVTLQSIKEDLIDEFVEEGVFASQDVNEFRSRATFVAASDKFKNYLRDDKGIDKDSLLTIDKEGNTCTAVYVRDGKDTCILGYVPLKNGDLEAYIESLKPQVVEVNGEKKEQVSEEFLKLQDMLKEKYENKSFAELQLEDVRVGNSYLATWLNLGVEIKKNKENDNKVEDKAVVTPAKKIEEQKDIEKPTKDEAPAVEETINPVVEEFVKKVAPKQPSLITANYVYEEAYNEAIRNLSQIQLVNPDLFKKLAEQRNEIKENDKLEEVKVETINNETPKQEEVKEPKPIELDADEIEKSYEESVNNFASLCDNLTKYRADFAKSNLSQERREEYSNKIEEISNNIEVFRAQIKEMKHSEKLEEKKVFCDSLSKSLSTQKEELRVLIEQYNTEISNENVNHFETLKDETKTTQEEQKNDVSTKSEAIKNESKDEVEFFSEDDSLSRYNDEIASIEEKGFIDDGSFERLDESQSTNSENVQGAEIKKEDEAKNKGNVGQSNGKGKPQSINGKKSSIGKRFSNFEKTLNQYGHNGNDLMVEANNLYEEYKNLYAIAKSNNNESLLNEVNEYLKKLDDIRKRLNKLARDSEQTESMIRELRGLSIVDEPELER